METCQKVLTVTPATWDEAAQACFSHPVIRTPLESIRRAVESGGALFQVKADGAQVGFYVLTVEGREGVLLVAVGNDPGTDLTASLVPIIEKQFQGLEAIRIHTRRPGLAKKLATMGYEPEMVLRKAL